MSKNTNKIWAKLQEFQNDHKELLILIADPKTDEISISFNKQFAFVKFPAGDMSKGVVFNALRQSKFAQAIDAFIRGVIESTGIDVTNKSGNELLSLLGGSIKKLGVGEKVGKLEVINKSNKNGKRKKG